MGREKLQRESESIPEQAKLGLPRTVESLCPECLKVIPAQLYESAGRVLMSKVCPEHGLAEDVVSASSEIFLRAERYAAQAPGPPDNPIVEEVGECPTSCGICAGHLSPASLTNLDLTNRCNLRCPFCFANANVQDHVYEPDAGQIEGMLDRALSLEPRRMQAVQFSGGEPTLSPYFLDACRMAKERGIKLIQAATNGIRFAKEAGFAERAAEAGLNGAYLQFDGIGDEVYQTTRGVKGLWDVKLKALDAFRRAGIRVTLVPTLVKGINDHQVGNILKFAISNLDVVVGLAPQPVAFTGRIDARERLQKRYTAADVALDVERQTGLLKAGRDWFPFAVTAPFARVVDNVLGADARGFLAMQCTSHPDCGISSFLLVNQDTGVSVPLNELFDIDLSLAMVRELGEKTEKHRSRLYATSQFISILLKTYRPEKAPKGLNFIKLAKTVDAISGGRVMGIAKKKRYQWRLLLVACMHFMDSYNYQVERAKQCTIHYSAPDGRIYPFCTYNSGKVFRRDVEKAWSVPKAEWQRRFGNRYVSEGFYE